MIDAIVCPYCRFKDPAPKDCDEGVNPYQCRDCGQTFDVVKETIVTYRAIATSKVVPWQNSKIGDLTEFNGKLARIHKGIAGRCPQMCMFVNKDCPRHFDIPSRLLCGCHPSGDQVYFEEVKRQS